MKEWLQDHDSDRVSEVPPVQNTWYEFFDAEDVRLLWCAVKQNNDESAAKDLEVRWTIDGNVYFVSWAADHNTLYYIYRNYLHSAGGTSGLAADTTIRNGAYYVDKRGLVFKAEVRLTGVPGTNQALYGWVVRETLEVT